VRKYWPEEEENEVKETAEVKLSLEDEFRLATTKNELSWDLAEALIMIGNRKWETRELRKEGAGGCCRSEAPEREGRKGGDTR